MNKKQLFGAEHLIVGYPVAKEREIAHVIIAVLESYSLHPAVAIGILQTLVRLFKDVSGVSEVNDYDEPTN